ncbi:hypothetical protein H0H93_005508 [Arthromyces matolae]|nr:hypothetical protein H0H93_005508 [Arthromyces matolae]
MQLVTGLGPSLLSSAKENLPPMESAIPRIRQKATTKVEHIQNALDILQNARISLSECLLTVLDDSNQDFFDYRTAFFNKSNSWRLERFLELIWKHEKGSYTMKNWLKPHAVDYVCNLVSHELEAAKPSLMMNTDEVTPEFISTWDINSIMEPIAEKITPTWARVLHAATEPSTSKVDKAATSRSRNRRAGRNIISASVSYLRSFNSCKVQMAMGLVALSTGASRDLINIMHTSCLSISYTSISNMIRTLSARSIESARTLAATEPIGISYDNVNVSTSIFVEQVPGALSKVQSGTFSVLYRLCNARREDMLAAPIIERFQNSKGLTIADLRGSSLARESYQTQSIINIAQVLFKYVNGFENYRDRREFLHPPRRKLPDGHKTEFHPLQASTIEEASIEGNIQNHEDIMINQLCRDLDDLNKFLIPAINDQLTNARNRGAQVLRKKDLTPWSRREVLALGFGTFHLLMNLIWMILNTHRGSSEHIGSLTHLFAAMEKVRLGSEHPDFHTLLQALLQILDGLLLNAWRTECGYPSLNLYAESKPASIDILKTARAILRKYATPKESLERTKKPGQSNSKGLDGEESSDDEDTPSSSTGPMDSSNDPVHENVVRLTRDLLMVTELVNAVSVGDFGRVEDMLPDLACMFRGGGSNNYSTEILYFLHNLKEVWTPEFANIMRDNMLVNVSGLAGHWMAIDLNIEHLIGYLKVLFVAKGIYSNWERLGNLSACIGQLQTIKARVTRSLGTQYQGSTHTTRDPSALVWRIADKAKDCQLQQSVPRREDSKHVKLVSDLRFLGCTKFASSSLATFNKKLEDLKQGISTTQDEEDTLPVPDFLMEEGSE